MITWLLALILSFNAIPQPGGFDVFIQFRLTEAPRQGQLCTAPLDAGFEYVAELPGNLNVRALPTTASGIVGTLRNGDTVKFWPPVTGTTALGTDVWYYIHLPESEIPGYVSGGAFKPPELSWGC